MSSYDIGNEITEKLSRRQKKVEKERGEKRKIKAVKDDDERKRRRNFFCHCFHFYSFRQNPSIPSDYYTLYPLKRVAL